MYALIMFGHILLLPAAWLDHAQVAVAERSGDFESFSGTKAYKPTGTLSSIRSTILVLVKKTTISRKCSSLLHLEIRFKEFADPFL